MIYRVFLVFGLLFSSGCGVLQQPDCTPEFVGPSLSLCVEQISTNTFSFTVYDVSSLYLGQPFSVYGFIDSSQMINPDDARKREDIDDSLNIGLSFEITFVLTDNIVGIYPRYESGGTFVTDTNDLLLSENIRQ